MLRRLGLIIVVILIMVAIWQLGVHPYTAAIITAALVIGINTAVSIILNNKRTGLLNTECDPEAYLGKMEKLREKSVGKNPKATACLDINISAALISSGEFEEAKEVLLSIDKNLLSVKNGSLFAYTVNLIWCYYELGETELAEKLFETQMPVLAPINKKMTVTVQMLVADRYFFLKRYAESRECLTKLWKEKMNRRNRLEILYRLAQIDELEGNTEAALKKYSQVAMNGNKLWIAAKAREKCEQMKGG